MKFKDFQRLNSIAIDKLKKEEFKSFKDQEKSMDAITLAYIGDSYYSTFVRAKVIGVGIYKTRVIHNIVTKIICAKGQARAYDYLEPFLEDEEKEIAKRARNSNLNIPKSAEVWEYRYSTALEAVLGYLYLKDSKERLDHLCSLAFNFSVKEL